MFAPLAFRVVTVWRYGGGDARSWMNMQVTYDLKVAQRDLGERIAAEVLPREGVDQEIP
ncbi:hypothetical protein ACIP1U_22785 [Cupriavidus sp. NPDC089707]|uniref:hypothetical protein n=1 Tax=Cupriavidus sp. NPDC089707 TaxID=3363963 RepID=UPI00381FB23B